MPATATEKTAALTAFRRQLPHELSATNLDGVFHTPAPPADFNIQTASAAALVKQGIFLRHPTAQDPPEVQAAWTHILTHKWGERIVPVMHPQVGVTHQRRSVRRTSNAAITSNNWAGGSIRGSWTSVTGTWVVPTVTKPREPQGQEGGWNSSSWVGIDGAYGSNDVLQAGVQQRLDGRGNASYVAWFEWFAPSKAVLSDTSPHTPALASLNGNIYIAWKGDGNDNLNVMVSTNNGESFQNKFISGETSPQAPALAAHNGALFISWKGDGNDNLNVASVTLNAAGSPTGFANKVTLGDTSPLSPSLASAGGNLYLAWRGDGNDQLNVMVSRDNGRTFGAKFVSGETSTQAPVLGTLKGGLMIAWKGDGNDNLNVARVNTNPAPTGLSNKVTLGETSPRSPALAELNGQLFLGWKGDGNDNLNLVSSADGLHFGNKLTSFETSPEAPSLTVNNGAVFMGWKGDGNDNLNVADFVELQTGSPNYIFQTNISNFPVKPGDKVSCSVAYVGRTAGQITFGNQTTGQNFSITLAPPPGASFSGNSAEWIMEAPDFGEPNSALPQFTPVAFSSAFACPVTTGAGIGNPQNGDTWTVVNNSVNPAQTLTAETLGSDTVNITFLG